MNILDRFRVLDENFYLDSMTEADEDPGDQSEQQPPQQQDPAMMGDDPNMDPSMAGDYGMGGGDPSMMGADGMGMGGDPSMMGGGLMGQEEIKTSTELGRMYELNKIYCRLYIINKFLKNTSDEKLQETKKMVSEAFDIYRLILNNIKSYKDKIDEIILQYYEFISHLVLAMEDYYNTQYNKSDNKEQN